MNGKDTRMQMDPAEGEIMCFTLYCCHNDTPLLKQEWLKKYRTTVTVIFTEGQLEHSYSLHPRGTPINGHLTDYSQSLLINRKLFKEYDANINRIYSYKFYKNVECMTVLLVT